MPVAGLAFLAAGNSTTRGKYSKVVKKAVEYFLKTQNKQSGYYYDGQSRVHGHGFAMLFMAEVYGQSSKGTSRNADTLSEKMKESLQKGANLIVASQATCGGFPYNLTGKRTGSHEGSTTVCAAEGLRAARDVGIYVDKKSIDLGLEYMKKTYGNGSFAYRYPQKGGNSLALSAAGAVVLISFGSQSKEVQDMISACVRFIKTNGRSQYGFAGGHFSFYTAFYATQTMHFTGGKDWDSWYKMMKRSLLTSMQRDYSRGTGFWLRGSETSNAAFATGIALLILQMPNEYLPIFQK